MPKAYSYKRFSTPEQSKGDTIRRQTQSAEDWALQHNIVLDDELSFDDRGKSAFKGGNRTTGNLGKFLYAVNNGLVEEGSYLLVEDLDRISRDKPSRALTTLQLICQSGITVVTLKDNKEFTEKSMEDNPFDLMMALMSFIRAHEESDVKSKRIKAAWSEKRKHASTRPLTSRGPAWLELNKETENWSVIDERAKIVRNIYKWSLEGMGQHAIANKLNTTSVPVFGRGKYWHRSYIAKILKNNSVLGTLTPNTLSYKDDKKVYIPEEPVLNYYPAIIEETVWLKVQSLKSHSLSPNRGRHAGKITNNLLGGLSKCPLCKSTMTLVNKGKRSKPKLVCTNAKTGAGCKYHGVTYEDVQRNLLAYMSQIHGDIPSGNKTDIDTRVVEKEAEVCGIEEARDNLISAIETKGHTDTLLNRLDELDIYHLEAKQQLDGLQIEQYKTTGLIAKSKLDDLQKEAVKGDKLDRTKMNAILRQVFKCVIINYPTGYLDFEWQQGGWSSHMFAWPTSQPEAEPKAT